MDNSEITAREKISPPLNINVANDYMGVDRGLFSIVSGNSIYYARITSASYRTNGPTLAPGLLTYKIETFDTFPMTTEDYQNSIKSDTVYTTYTSGSKSVPILIEYWAKTSFINIYANKVNVDEMNPLLVEGIKSTGDSYTSVLLGAGDDRSITVNIEYLSTATLPLTIQSYTITISKEGSPDTSHVVPLELITPLFDPVQYIRGL